MDARICAEVHAVDEIDVEIEIEVEVADVIVTGDCTDRVKVKDTARVGC